MALVRCLLWCLSTWSVFSVFFVFPGVPTAVLAEETSKPYFYIPDVPEQIDQVDFYLLTVGIGDDLAARYGHTGIRVVNHLDKTDVVFNWGKFYFDDPMFAVSFYRGDLTYSMGVRTYKRDIEHHQEDNRKVLQEKINLNNRQKTKLLEKIAFNARPENRDFKYQYWFKNCSTIPRDYLNEVTEGQIRDKYYSAGSGKTFRDYVRSNLSYTPGMIPVLDTIMNSRIDREISKWEEMFLPGKLREYLLGMNAIDGEGNPIAGVPLLSQSTIVVDNPEHYRDFLVDYTGFGLFIYSVLIGTAFLLFSGKRTHTAMRVLGFAVCIYGCGSGFFGVVMTLNWLFSGHPDIWHNANLLFFPPFDLIFVVVGFRLFKAGAPVVDRYPFPRAAESLVWMHVAMFLVAVIGKMLGLIDQQIGMTLVIFAVPSLMILLVFVTRAVRKFVPDNTLMPMPVGVADPVGAKRGLRQGRARPLSRRTSR